MEEKLIRKGLLRLARNYPMGRVRFQRIFQLAYRFGLLGMNYGVTADLRKSGETRIIDFLSERGQESYVIFDIGANRGGYAFEVLARLGNRAVVYCFEPSAAAYRELARNLGDRNNVYLYHLGLGHANEIATLYSDVPGSELASVFHRDLTHSNIYLDNEERVQLRRLDDLCTELGISHIDLLKLDVECNEFNILRGASSMIDSAAIDFIQFEFGGLDARTYFHDYFSILSSRYVIHRVVRDGLVSLEKYDERMEIFQATNYLAVSRKLVVPSRLKRSRLRGKRI